MSYVIVTPSFAGDYERCRLLAESVERMVPGAEHYVLVDGVDVPRFRPLADFGARVVDARELMDARFRRIPTTRLWLTPGGRIARGWITQQIRKLAFACASPRENILCVDSDVVFVRPFDPGSTTRDGRTPLFEIDWFNDESLGWANQSRRLLGLPERPGAKGYVHPTFWRRSAVRSLLAAVEGRTQRPWQSVLATMRTFSEYTLYGIYVREVLGLEAAGMYSFNQPLMHPSWDFDLRSESGMRDFVSRLADDQVAIMFHSKDGVQVRQYEHIVRKLWRMGATPLRETVLLEA